MFERGVETSLTLIPPDLLLDVCLLNWGAAVELIVVVWIPVCFQDLTDVMLRSYARIKAVDGLCNSTWSLILCWCSRSFHVWRLVKLLLLNILYRNQTRGLLSRVQDIVNLVGDLHLMIDQPLRSNRSTVLLELARPNRRLNGTVSRRLIHEDPRISVENVIVLIRQVLALIHVITLSHKHVLVAMAKDLRLLAG